MNDFKTKVSERKYSTNRANITETTYVIKTFMGWIVETTQTADAYSSNGGITNSTAVAQTFVSDPAHEWKFEAIK